MGENRTKTEGKSGRRFWHALGKYLRKFCKLLGLLVLLCLLAGIAGGWWLTQTQKGQAWLVEKANASLASENGMSFRITSLSGSIPWDFRFGLESSDKGGVWLTAPDNHIAWDWKALPGAIHFRMIAAEQIDIARFPEAQEQAEQPAPRQPLTTADIRRAIGSASDFLSKSHWWLPGLNIDAISASALLPAALLPATSPQRLAANATVGASFVDNQLHLNGKAELKNGLGERILAPSMSFTSASLGLDLQAFAKAGGITAQCGLNGNVLGPQFEIRDLPPDIAGASMELALKADAAASPETISINIEGPSINAGHARMNANAKWRTDDWQDFSGPADCLLSLVFEPLDTDKSTPLGAIRSPASLKLTASGNLPKLNLELELSCAELKQGTHTVADASISLVAKNLSIPINQEALKALEEENQIGLSAGCLLDGQKIDLETQLFAQALAAGSWRVGLRDLAVSALGLSGAGKLAVLLPEGKTPGIDGLVKLEVKDWAGINKLVPGQKLSGDVRIEAALASGAPSSLADAESRADPAQLASLPALRQSAAINLAIPSFRLQPESGKPVRLERLKGDIKLDNLFAEPEINARLDAGNISAAGLGLAADINAAGPFKGPIQAQINSKGSINSRVSAQWQPGEARLLACEVLADLAALTGTGRKGTAGIRALQPATIRYGDKGIQVNSLDLRILPSGRLRANGGMAPDKLDFRLNLENLEFKPWQAILPQLPGGSANVNASLEGSPKKPSGNFKLNFKDIRIAQNLPVPLNFSLTGAIAGQSLNARLELDPATVKAFGGNVAQISARLPLSFGDDGVPKPDLAGKLEAKVRWEGALGPIWNLLPIPDRRLNGRISMDLDAGGSLNKPKIRGYAAISKARYEDLLLGVLLTDINLRVDLSEAGKGGAKGPLDSLPGSIKLALNIADGVGGTVTASGSGALDGNNLDIKANINKLKPLRRRDIHIELSGNAQVTGSATAPVINGEIIVNKGEVLLNNLAMTGSVTTLDITDAKQLAREKAAVAAPVKPVGSLNVRIVMQPRFSVEGRGLASLWQANLLVSGPLNDPKITGNISSVRGNFDFLGKVFALTRGIVFFGGGSIANPLLDMELTYDTPDLVAHIMVNGPVNKIRLTLSSDPSMPRDEILSRVLFGRSLNDLSRMEALQLAGAVAQLAGVGGGSSPLSSMKKALGVDVLRLGTANTGSANQSSDDTGGGTTVEMGKYINDYIYMGVQQGFKADSTAFIIEIELTPRTNLEVRTEQNNTWGGIKWKMNY